MSDGADLDPALDPSAPLYVAGHRGLVGGAIWRAFERAGHSNLVGRSHAELDLCDRRSVFEFMATTKPRYLVLAAAKVGGILANDTHPTDFLSENLQIQTNVMDAALETGVERLLFLGSSCIYPRLAAQPISESELLTGPLEPTNEAYAIAKIAGVIQVQSVRRQHHRRWISAMPTNLYGPGDNFSPTGSHLLPALIRRYEAARLAGEATVTNWGTGSPRRELMHVEDLASACIFLLSHYDELPPINVGTGVDATISEIAELVAETVGYEGETRWDIDKPDGTPQKLLDVSRLARLGWNAEISLREGIRSTVDWYREQHGAVRQSG